MSAGVPQNVSQFGLELGDLAVEFDDDAHRGSGGRAERGGDRRGSGELLDAQHRRDLLSTNVHIALAPTMLKSWIDGMSDNHLMESSNSDQLPPTTHARSRSAGPAAHRASRIAFSKSTSDAFRTLDNRCGVRQTTSPGTPDIQVCPAPRGRPRATNTLVFSQAYWAAPVSNRIDNRMY